MKKNYTFVGHLKRELMKKRSFYAMVMVVIGLFFATSLISQDDNTSVTGGDDPIEGDWPRGTSTGDINGVYVPD